MAGCPVADDKLGLSSLSLTKLQLEKTDDQQNTGRAKLTKVLARPNRVHTDSVAQ